ncbi:MAG: type IV pilus assembly protein PilM [Candidatus Pacebacteria bacterium]|nr:type IV pilus assembly protein PilM [Candidatus Paceibacterota bacterium]MCF7857484.1 type IV pilus assembly protein PilM [Candidatus Paceibacterota bacterium]
MGFDLSSLTSFLKTSVATPSKDDAVIGIDIGSSTIKIVQLKNAKGVPTVETYGELQLGPYEGVDIGRATHLPSNKLTEALIDILREAGAKGKLVAFALSYNSSFSTIISIPSLDQKKIGAIVPVEARKYIPISLTKVTLDWMPLEVSKEDKVTNVLITAIYNEAYSRYESIMLGGSLETVASEIETFSSIRSLVSPQDECVAIIDWGASSTRLYIIEKGVARKTHSVLMSGSELTGILEKELKIEFKDAEELKRSVGLRGKEEDPRIEKAIARSLERGLRELHTVVVRYEETGGAPVQKVIMSGGGALLQGVMPYVSDMFSKPVVVADPFQKVAYPAFLEDTLKEAGPPFAVAVGIALRAFQTIQ